MHSSNKGESSVHCPYCGNNTCYSKNLRIWVVSCEVKRAVEMSQMSQVAQSILGLNGDYKITHYEDGLMMNLGNID